LPVRVGLSVGRWQRALVVLVQQHFEVLHLPLRRRHAAAQLLKLLLQPLLLALVVMLLLLLLLLPPLKLFLRQSACDAPS